MEKGLKIPIFPGFFVLGVVTEQPIHRFRINALIFKAIINN